MNKKGQSGQVALIVLLISVVMLTVGLSVISQSVTDVSISKDEEEAMRAFSAAEAGIEEALKQVDLGNWTPNPEPVGGITPNITVTTQHDLQQYSLVQGETIDVRLPGTATNLTISWTNPEAAIETTYYNADGVSARGAYYQSGSSPCGSTLSTGFSSVTSPSSFSSLAGDILLRIRALCGSTDITVTGTGLPAQGYEITSRAAIGGTTTEGKTSSIEVSRSMPVLPSIFDYVLYSGDDLKME